MNENIDAARLLRRLSDSLSIRGLTGSICFDSLAYTAIRLDSRCCTLRCFSFEVHVAGHDPCAGRTRDPRDRRFDVSVC